MRQGSISSELLMCLYVCCSDCVGVYVKVCCEVALLNIVGFLVLKC